MIKKLFLYFQILFIVGLISSCATQPTSPTGSYKLTSKAKVTDKTSAESHNIDLIIVVDPQRAVRMDVSALMGYRLAEIVLTPKLIQYIQHEDKIFVQGEFKPKTLKRLFNQEIDPKLLWAMAHEQNLPDGLYYGANVKTEFLESDSGRYRSKRVTIENNYLKMIWLFKSKEGVALSYNETFVLAKPDEYKLITIK